MRINTNISALNAWRIYNGTATAIGRTIARLSSGQRINSAADDPAGLAISERMRNQIRSMNQAMRNIQDGISLVRATEGTLNEVTQMLQRGRELAVQAANGVWTPEEKGLLQGELTNIADEIDRIASTAEFNRRPLLGGGGQAVGKLVESLRRSWLAPAETLV
ncbi:MAG: flagellin, partial [Firmicutes bacterium]|nr:flagellin [Bacillota bacterium]